MILFVLPPCRAALPAAGQQPDADRRDRPMVRPGQRPAAATGREVQLPGGGGGSEPLARKARGSKGRLADARGYGTTTASRPRSCATATPATPTVPGMIPTRPSGGVFGITSNKKT